MTSDRVVLGLMPPLTGLVGMYGDEVVHAGQIACAEVNEQGGVLGRPLALAVEDDGSLPESAVDAATRLIEQHHVSALVGNLLSNSRIAVAYQVAEPRKIPYLNFSFYEGSILSRYFFHFAALPNQQIARMIPFMRERYGPRMFFAGHNYEWPRGSIDAAMRVLTQSGGQVLGELYYPLGVSDEALDELLDQVAASAADVFVPYFAGADQTRLLTRFSERGLKDRIAVVMGHYDEVMASRLPASVRAGFYSSNTYFMSLDTPENRAYLQRLGGLPGVHGIWPRGNGILTNFGEGTYLCVKAFAAAANQAGELDPEALIAALERVSVTGPQGRVRMDPETHHAQVNTYLARCEADGAFTLIERFGAIPPELPERYRHLRMARQLGLEDVYLQSRMLAQISEAVFLVDALEGTIVYANPGAEHTFGHTQAQMVGQHYVMLFAASGEHPAVVSAIGEALARKGVWQGETEQVTRDGRRIWCATSMSVFTHPRHGEVWLILNTDISDRKRMEQALRHYHEELEARVRERTATLEELNRELEDFAYSVSHDLRTPLRAIDGYARLLLDEYAGRLDQEGQRYLGVVRENAQRMGQLIDGVLACVHVGRTGMSPVEVDMERLVRTVLADLQSAHAARALELRLHPLPPGHGDYALLRQLWEHLLANAIKFTRPREPGVIEIGGEARETECVYYVRDNGVGFDMRYAHKLFGVFHRLHGVEEFEGTGIGLAIVKRIATRHGGRVWAEGRVGEGATFFVALPRR